MPPVWYGAGHKPARNGPARPPSPLEEEKIQPPRRQDTKKSQWILFLVALCLGGSFFPCAGRDFHRTTPCAGGKKGTSYLIDSLNAKCHQCPERAFRGSGCGYGLHFAAIVLAVEECASFRKVKKHGRLPFPPDCHGLPEACFLGNDKNERKSVFSVGAVSIYCGERDGSRGEEALGWVGGKDTNLPRGLGCYGQDRHWSTQFVSARRGCRRVR